MFSAFGFTPIALDPMKDFIWQSVPFKLNDGSAATPMLSPSASFTASAFHVPENTAFTLPSRKPARPAPSASLIKLGFATTSTK